MNIANPPNLGVICRTLTRLEPNRHYVAQVYGTDLHWYTNHPLLETEIHGLVERWKQAKIPTLGRSAKASAFVMPSPDESWSSFEPPTKPQITGHLLPHGMLILGEDGSFGLVGKDRREAIVGLRDTADLHWSARTILEPTWKSVLLWRPPIYAIHASAVARHGKAAVFIGEHMTGKSSLVAALVLLRNYGYMADDLTLLDGRTFQVHGHPWTIELRDATQNALWQGQVLPAGGRRLGEKTVWDTDRLFHGRLVCTAEWEAVLFMEKGTSFSIRPLSSKEIRRKLPPPRSLDARRLGIGGYKPVFDALAENVQGYALVLDHSLGVIECAMRVAETLDKVLI